MSDVLSRLMKAVAWVPRLAPLGCEISLTNEGVELRFRLRNFSSLKIVTWLELEESDFNPLTYWMSAIREDVLARWSEGPTSTNPNREHWEPV